MAYIGQGIKQGTFKVLDTSGNTYNGSNTTFSLGTQVGSAAQLLVSHDGVIQLPGTDYTLATGGTQITFSTAPASGASIFITEISGAVGGTVTPSDTSVTADKLNSALLTGQTDIGANIADADLFLIDDGAGGTLRKTAASRLKTYIGTSPITALNNATANELVTVGSTTTELDAEGNLTFDGGTLTVKDDANGSTTETLVVTNGTSANPSYSNLVFKTGGNTSGCWIKGVQASGGNDGRLEFHTNNSGTVGERLRIMFDGKILANTSSPIDTNAAFSIKELNNYPLATKVDATVNTQQIGFFNGNGQVGGITTNGSATAYNTSSDYRLKENISYDFDATTRLKQLKPARFNWIADDTNTLLDGFLAHEVSSIVPESITGSKDATETKQNVVLNANGTMIYNGVPEQEHTEGKEKGTYPSNSTWVAEKEVPVYQSIDQAKLVPLLVKTVQELEARIKALEDA